MRADLLALLDGDAAAVCAAACYKFVRQESSVDETVTEKMCGDEDEGGPGGSESFAAGGMWRGASPVLINIAFVEVHCAFVE